MLKISHTGSYSVVVTSDSGCQTNAKINVTSLPPNSSFQANDSIICSSECVKFSDKSSGATLWQWTFLGGTPSTSTNQNPQVCYLKSGIYDVTLIASNPSGSNSLTLKNYITVQSSPSIPKITQVDTILYCSTDSSYASYQWYRDSILLNGATDTLLVIHNSGNYNVKVTNENGCKNSAGINVVIGLQNYMSDYVISISPNPVKTKFTLYDLKFTNIHIDIYNIIGQVCQQSEIANRKSVTEVDVSSLPSGIYFVQLIGEKERWVGRFVKE